MPTISHKPDTQSIQLNELNGWLGADIYSTAWLAAVPHRDDPLRPAWSQALTTLRERQLTDGGWGTGSIYYAYERTLATLAAIWALHRWPGRDPEDLKRIKRGVRALHRYAEDLPHEPHETIGFELALPRLVEGLQPYHDQLPLDLWAGVADMQREKLALMQQRTPIPGDPRAWWFSLEWLPDETLAGLDDSLLDENGAIASSTAATAAYLAARRQAGHDSPRAAAYLDRVFKMGYGTVPVGWPFDVFERVWVLDSYLRAGIDPRNEHIKNLAQSVHDEWHRGEPGLSLGSAFEVNDGDDTLVGFMILNWAWLSVDDAGIMPFWRGTHFSSYGDERTTSPSVNLHGLMALRMQPGFPHRDMAMSVTEWLCDQIKPKVIFDDKWHLSPIYSAAHAVPAFLDWDDTVATDCLSLLVSQQRPDGGWGWFTHSTPEETAHAVLALSWAERHGRGRFGAQLTKAARFLGEQYPDRQLEPMWIGKGLYGPTGIVEATIDAAKVALSRLGYRAARRDDERAA